MFPHISKNDPLYSWDLHKIETTIHLKAQMIDNDVKIETKSSVNTELRIFFTMLIKKKFFKIQKILVYEESTLFSS